MGAIGELFQHPGPFLDAAQRDAGQRQTMFGAVAAAGRLPSFRQFLRALGVGDQHRQAALVIIALGDARRHRRDRQRQRRRVF